MTTTTMSLLNELQNLPFINFSVNKNPIQTFWLEKEMEARNQQNGKNDNHWYLPLCSKDIIILYGIGAVGKKIFPIIKNNLKDKLVAICDNNYSSKLFYNTPVYNQRACLKKFPNATFLISPQTGFLSIAISLRKNGVKKENIFIYDNRRTRLEGDFRRSIKDSETFSSLFGMKPIVLYGIGQVGKKVYSELIKYYDINIEAICDNSFSQNIFEGTEVLKHSECLNKYPNALYLITPQIGYLNIAYKLLDDGVETHNIMFFNNAKNMIEKP